MEQQHGFPLPVAPCFPERASVKIGRWHLEKQLVFFFFLWWKKWGHKHPSRRLTTQFTFCLLG